MPQTPTASGPLKVALVGGGKMAEHHARAIARTATAATLVAVADPMESGRAAIAQVAPGARGFASLEELLAAEQPDVVHIVTPPQTHFALAQLALKAGCHVYIEKPVVERGSEVNELVALARSQGRSLCAGHQLLFEEPARRAVELLPSLGRVCHVESYFAFRPTRMTAGGRVAMRADHQLIDILPHPVYLLLHFLEAVAPGGRTDDMSLTVGSEGTVHGILTRGGVSGALTVTLTGRPVDSYVRIVGTNGTIHLDFVRSTVQQQIGPGSSGIDKVFAPYRTARQLVGGTTRSLARRILKRQRSYPGLTELFEAFYHSIRTGAPAPISEATIGETVHVCEQVSAALAQLDAQPTSTTPRRNTGPVVALTGGTGFLGRAVVKELLTRGAQVRVIARRSPAPWDRIPGVEYIVGDLGTSAVEEAFKGAEVALHAAAETVGGWKEHEANSLKATEHLMRGAAAAGIRKVVHVSSLAVVDSGGSAPVNEQTPRIADSRSAGPYVWGKLESEKIAESLAKELGLGLRIVRPGAIVDYAEFDPPGRLGKRVGNIFVAVGSSGDRLGVVDIGFTARVLVEAALNFEQAPAMVNLLDPELPTKASLLKRLKATNPDLSVVWLPMWLLWPMSLGAIVLQKLLKPGRPAMNVAKIFRVERFDNRLSAELAKKVGGPVLN